MKWRNTISDFLEGKAYYFLCCIYLIKLCFIRDYGICLIFGIIFSRYGEISTSKVHISVAATPKNKMNNDKTPSPSSYDKQNQSSLWNNSLSVIDQFLNFILWIQK